MQCTHSPSIDSHTPFVHPLQCTLSIGCTKLCTSALAGWSTTLRMGDLCMGGYATYKDSAKIQTSSTPMQSRVSISEAEKRYSFEPIITKIWHNICSLSEHQNWPLTWSFITARCGHTVLVSMTAQKERVSCLRGQNPFHQGSQEVCSCVFKYLYVSSTGASHLIDACWGQNCNINVVSMWMHIRSYKL